MADDRASDTLRAEVERLCARAERFGAGLPAERSVRVTELRAALAAAALDEATHPACARPRP